MNNWTTCTVIFIVTATGSVRFLPVHVTATCSFLGGHRGLQYSMHDHLAAMYMISSSGGTWVS